MRLAADRASASDFRVSGVGGHPYACSVTSTTDTTPDTTTHAPWLPLAAVSVTLVFWASAFVAIRHLGEDFSPGALSLGRLVVGAICLGAVALSRGLPRPSGRQW